MKRILVGNFVCPDEAQKVLSRLRKKRSYTVTDMITARLELVCCQLLQFGDHECPFG